MRDELIDIVNNKDEIIAQEMKSVAHKKGLWHRSAHILILKQHNQLRMQANEISELRFISIDNFKKDINKNPKKYTPHKYWNEIILKLELTLH